jgi:glycosyltransferase involved in cell wall biosynthesis
MKLSIVTPTLNSYKFIKECADSILIHQNYNNIEWIVADGGSTDGTVEYLKDLKNNKIILINENTGHSTKAYNVGISKTSGDIIGTLGSDDIYNKNIFLKVINYFKDENLLWVVGRNEIIDKNDKIVRKKITNFKNNKLDKYSYHSLTKNNFFPMQSIFWRRSFMPLKTGYFNEFEFLDSSDYEMWLKMARLSKPLIVKEKFSFFRMHKTNITSKGSFKQLNQMAKISNKYGNFNFFEKIIIRVKSIFILSIYRILNFFI